MGDAIRPKSTVCSMAPRSQSGKEARFNLCGDK